MPLTSTFEELHQPAPSRPRKLWSLVRAVRNWPRTLADHAGVARRDYVCTLRNGLRFHVRGGTDDRHVLFEVFARGIYPVRLAPDSTVVDIGAQIGAFTLLAASSGARVFSYEPFPENFSALERNLALNGTDRVRAFPMAVTGRTESRTLFVPDDGGHTGRFSLHPGRGDRTIAADCISLDGIVDANKLERIDLLKIDCQGSEYEILYGAAQETLRRVRALIVECEVFPSPSEWSVQSLRRHLQRAGFETEVDGNLLYAARPAGGA